MNLSNRYLTHFLLLLYQGVLEFNTWGDILVQTFCIRLSWSGQKVNEM